MLAAKQAPSIGLRAEHQDAIHTFQFKKPVVVIGRDPNCECTLPSEKVSANHARLSFHQNQWWIEDLNSTNGSFLNDEPVLKPAVVVDGDLLRCGNVMLTIQLEAA
jgi:pSer/pThr/pTyr-binding forkhead associated (FHA) protein